MTNSVPVADVDRRFGGPAAEATPWPEAVRVLANAERYWLSTIRADGRPQVTPLVGVWQDDALHFCTPLEEHVARILDHQPHVAVTTGRNIWARGMDVVVEGDALQVTGTGALQRLADAFEAKYGGDWTIDLGAGVLGSGAGAAAVFRVDAEKVIAFARRPHAQTEFRFTGR